MVVPTLLLQSGKATTLAENVDNLVAIIPVASSQQFNASGYALIGDPLGTYEVVAVSGVKQGYLVVTRGVDSNHAAASHTAGVAVIVMEPVFATQIASIDSTLADGVDIELGSSVGSMIGTAASQKLAFHGSTPVIQRAGAAQAAVATTAATSTTPFGYSQAQADAIVALVNELRAALVAKGIIKGSA